MESLMIMLISLVGTGHDCRSFDFGCAGQTPFPAEPLNHQEGVTVIHVAVAIVGLSLEPSCFSLLICLAISRNCSSSIKFTAILHRLRLSSLSRTPGTRYPGHKVDFSSNTSNLDNLPEHLTQQDHRGVSIWHAA